MLTLALDTATHDLVVGVGDQQSRRVDAQRVIRTRSHNELLVPTVNELLAEAGCTYGALDAIVVGVGPGPFTGLRVGMATASAFGQALGVPVYGVCTHDAIAAEAAEAGGTEGKSVLVVTDARRREVYWSLYRDGRRVDGPHVSAASAIDVEGAEVDLLVVPEALRETVKVAAGEVRDLAPGVHGLLAACDTSVVPGPLTPLYLRRPDAVPPKPRPRSAALPDIKL